MSWASCAELRSRAALNDAVRLLAELEALIGEGVVFGLLDEEGQYMALGCSFGEIAQTVKIVKPGYAVGVLAVKSGFYMPLPHPCTLYRNDDLVMDPSL